MRRWIIGAFFGGLALAGGYAVAQIVPALPFQLQNNTVADATQVMANFNQILNNVNTNGAKNGANSDITSLLGLTTPLAPSVGGTSTWAGGTSTGSANAQAVTPVVPATFTFAVGNRVVFKAGFTNTAGLTLNVAGIGATAVFRKTQAGVVTTVGGEIIAGEMVTVVFDGTLWQIEGATALVGDVRDFIGTTAPAGWAIADGTCVSQTTYATLFAVASTTWGACGAGLFALPDYRGRGGLGKDGAGRITTACAAANTLATGCGVQNQTIAQAQLPNVNFTLSVSDTRTWATSNALFPAAGGPGGFVGGTDAALSAAQAVVVTGGTIGGTAASGGSGTALTTLPPGLIVNKIIKL